MTPKQKIRKLYLGILFSLVTIGLAIALLCTGCTINFKGKDIEFEAQPAEPNLEWSQNGDRSYELYTIDIF